MAAAEWAELERALDELVAGDRFSGNVLVTEGDDTLLEFCGGAADRATGRPNGPGTRFGLASASKMFTAVAVLTCVRDGLLRVEDRAVDLLPAARRPRTMPDEVTVHHLLTHTSGIGDYAEEDEDLPGYVADYAALWRDRPAYRMERPDDFLPLYADAEPVAAPGSGFHYSNAGFVLLGALLEEVTGTDFVAAVTERVLGPAGMPDTGYFRLDEAVPDLAVGYLPGKGPEGPWRSNVYSIPVIGSGDGGAFATARDLDRFLRVLESGDLLGDRMGELMRERHVEVEEGFWAGYGVFTRPGIFGHGGGDPGVETVVRRRAVENRSVIVLCNTEGCFDAAWDLVQPGG